MTFTPSVEMYHSAQVGFCFLLVASFSNPHTEGITAILARSGNMCNQHSGKNRTLLKNAADGAFIEERLPSSHLFKSPSE